MKYEVIHSFADLNDNKHKYETGDEFPRPGLEVSEDRIKELSSSRNKAKMILIKEKPEPVIKEQITKSAVKSKTKTSKPKSEPQKNTTKKRKK